jgi:hypothetical protein
MKKCEAIRSAKRKITDTPFHAGYLVWCNLYILVLLIVSPALSAQSPKPIIVSPDGKGHFKTIQSAINSLPTEAAWPRIIHIKKGVYNEKVYIETTATGREVMILPGMPTTCRRE